VNKITSHLTEELYGLRAHAIHWPIFMLYSGFYEEYKVDKDHTLNYLVKGSLELCF